MPAVSVRSSSVAGVDVLPGVMPAVSDRSSSVAGVAVLPAVSGGSSSIAGSSVDMLGLEPELTVP